MILIVKKLEFLFLTITITAISALLYNYYQSSEFKRSEIPESYQKRIIQKEQEILLNMKNNLGFAFKVPLIVSDAFKGRLYGLTSYENGEVKIYLNKKVMRESMDYMVDSVIAHEYAHAVMFKLGHIHTNDDGHSKAWQEVCKKLGGDDCQRYVDQQEIILSKMPFR